MKLTLKKQGKRGRVVALIVGIVLVLLAGFYIFLNYDSKVSDEVKDFLNLNRESFSVNPNYPIRLNIFDGESISKIEITNHENLEHNYELSVIGVENFTLLEETSFKLGAKDSKNMNLVFNRTSNVSGIYLGKLVVKNSISKKEVPILLNFEDVNSPFVILQKQIPKYDSIYPGGKLGIDIKVFDLQPQSFTKKLNVQYQIKNFNGETFFSSEEEIVLNKEYGYSKIIDISKDYNYGDYVFIVYFEYKEVKVVSPYLFTIEKKETFSFTEFNVFILLTLFFIVLIIILFFYFIKSRDDFLIQLKKQQGQELKKNLQMIEYAEKKLQKIKHEKERQIKTEKLKKIKEKIFKVIKAKHQKQVKEIRKRSSEKKPKKLSINQRLEQWKKEGFNLLGTEKEVKKASGKEISKDLDNWKKSGYDVSFLGK